MDDFAYLQRLPAELWTEIISYFLMKARQETPDCPYPLAGAGSTTTDHRKTAISLALTCRHFYNIAGPLLAEYTEIRTVAKFRTPERSQRSNLNKPSIPYLPSTTLLDIRQRASSIELYKPLHASFGNVTSLLLSKPSWCGKNFPGFLSAVGESVGPQVSKIYLIPSQNSWLIQDIVTLFTSLPQIRMLHIADIQNYDGYGYDDDDNDDNDYMSDSDDDLDSGADSTADGTGDDGPMNIDNVTNAAYTAAESSSLHMSAPAAAFPNLQWLGLGQLAFLPRTFGPVDSAGFEIILERLTGASCPKLVRLDVLQDVGPLRAALSRLDGVLQCLCLSASVLGHYSKSILGTPSLRPLNATHHGGLRTRFSLHGAPITILDFDILTSGIDRIFKPHYASLY